MKPQTKKRLIVISAVLFLTPIVYYGFNYDYHFSRNLGLTKQTQKIFWKRAYKNKIEKMGGSNFFSKGGTFFDGYPERKNFTLTLDDQWTASYDYEQWPDDKDTFEIGIFNNSNLDKSFTIYVNQKNLKVRTDQKYIDYASTSPQERQQIDRETTPDSITDTGYLEKLALDKFVEFQDEYFKVNGK